VSPATAEPCALRTQAFAPAALDDLSTPDGGAAAVAGAAAAGAAAEGAAVKGAAGVLIGSGEAGCPGCGIFICYNWRGALPPNASALARPALAAPAPIRKARPPTYTPSAKEVIAWAAEQFGISTKYLRVARKMQPADFKESVTGPGGKVTSLRHVRLEQVQPSTGRRGAAAIPVEYSQISVHLQGNIAYAVTGRTLGAQGRPGARGCGCGERRGAESVPAPAGGAAFLPP
jgi:hypothetical protein